MNAAIMIIPWVLLIWVLGAILYPICFSVFKNLPDRGYSFTKIFSIIFVTYIVWLLVLLKIVPYKKETIFLALIISSAFSFLKLKRASDFREFKNFIKKKWKILLVEDVLFLGLFFFGVIVLFLNPLVFRHAYVSENFMNLAFINKISVSPYFPPDNPWMSGFFLNYYYFGHLIASVLTKLLSVSINSYFAIWNITLFALVGTAGFGLIFNLSRSYRFGFLGTIFLSLSSRLDIVLALLRRIPLQDYYFNNNFLIEKPRACNEFPFYELTNHNPHSQVIASLFTVLLLALVYQLLTDKGSKKTVLLLGFFLAGLFFTHGWDLPPMAGLVIVALFLTQEKIKNLFSSLFVLGSSFFAFSSPFLVNFKPPFKKLIFYFTPSGIIYTPIIFGLFLYPTAWYLVKNLENLKKLRISKLRRVQPEILFLGLCLLIALLLVIVPNFVYLKDCWQGPFNTFYKAYFLAWILLSIAGSGFVFLLSKKLSKKVFSSLFLPGLVILMMISLGASFMAVYQRIGEGKLVNRFNLDGLAFLKDWNEEEYQAILWVQKNTPPEAIILENGVGDYTLYNRVSALTGRSTVIGWPFHQYCWQGQEQEIQKRKKEVDLIFTSQEESLRRRLIKKYNIDYIFIGTKEKEKYSQTQIGGLESIGKPVFQNSEVTILKYE